MRSSSLISVVPQTPGSSLPDLSSPDVCTPKNRLDSIMKQFESTSSEIAHNLKNYITELFREKNKSTARNGFRVKRNLGAILTMTMLLINLGK